MKGKKTIILLIISIIILSIGISINFIPENYTFLKDGTKVTGDIDKIEILNYTVYTYNRTWYPVFDLKFIGNGFIHSKNATWFEVMVYYKNIANEKLENISITIEYYDFNNTLLNSEEINNKEEISKLEKSETRSCFFEAFYAENNLEKAERVSFHITTSKFLDNNTIGIIVILVGILFLMATLYYYKKKK